MKYLSAVLALVVVSSLILTPTSRAVAAPAVVGEPEAHCETIALSVIQFSPNLWFIGVGPPNPNEPWLLFHGTAEGAVNYKGCTFYPSGTIFSFGPYTGVIAENFNAPKSAMVGTWQVLSETATSPKQVIQ